MRHAIALNGSLSTPSAWCGNMGSKLTLSDGSAPPLPPVTAVFSAWPAMIRPGGAHAPSGVPHPQQHPAGHHGPCPPGETDGQDRCCAGRLSAGWYDSPPSQSGARPGRLCQAEPAPPAVPPLPPAKTPSLPREASHGRARGNMPAGEWPLRLAQFSEMGLAGEWSWLGWVVKGRNPVGRKFHGRKVAFSQRSQTGNALRPA